MNEGLIPRRYAKALLKFAVEKGADARMYDLARNLRASFEANPEIDATLANPFLPADSKINLLTVAAGAKADDSVYADFLKLLKNNDRLPIARAIALAYIDDYRKSNDIYPVEVAAAAAMAPAEEERLKKIILSHLNGGKMEYTFKIDPQLIGGFTVNIGSQKLDASVKNELKQLHLKLLG